MPYTGKSNLATVSEHDARARREGNARFAGEDGGAKLPGKRRRMGVPLAFSLWGASLFDADEKKKTHMFTRTHAHTNVALATITRCFEEVRWLRESRTVRSIFKRRNCNITKKVYLFRSNKPPISFIYTPTNRTRDELNLWKGKEEVKAYAVVEIDLCH